LAERVTSADIESWFEENGFKDMEDFRYFLKEQTHQHRLFLYLLLKLVSNELSPFQEEFKREVAIISPEHRDKTPESVVEKILRSNGELTKENFAAEMDDLVRFRILCNYLSDVQRTVKRIRESKAILKEFEIISSEDRIWGVRIPSDDLKIEDERRRKRLTGVRGHYLVFRARESPEVKIEVQVTTLLENAWDRKDHHLVYEPERRGVKINQIFRLRVKSISDMLYVADEYFDVLRQELEKTKGGEGGG
jgi:ppGpp synthetase/RelA/SpoT-type nucleotidyltranferase